jgi:hypothetical protein
MNFNQRDPLELNISWWINYWTSVKLDALLLNALRPGASATPATYEVNGR